MRIKPEPDRLDRRRHAIMESARHLFVEQGFNRTTLGNIVDQSGGSMATIYKLFGSKEGLLAAVIFAKATSGETLVQRNFNSEDAPGAVLRRIAMDLHEEFLNPASVALVRIVIAHSIENPEFARHFFESTATRTRDALIRLFEDWHRSGVDMTAPPALLAEIFLGLNVGDLQTEAISHGNVEQISAEKLDVRTKFFLRGAGLND
ncbi:MAG: TetR/AcrR family transcriptional regulator [Alteraurantiacibacter sp.]